MLIQIHDEQTRDPLGVEELTSKEVAKRKRDEKEEEASQKKDKLEAGRSFLAESVEGRSQGGGFVNPPDDRNLRTGTRARKTRKVSGGSNTLRSPPGGVHVQMAGGEVIPIETLGQILGEHSHTHGNSSSSSSSSSSYFVAEDDNLIPEGVDSSSSTPMETLKRCVRCSTINALERWKCRECGDIRFDYV